jgi:hypothetical protein
MSHYDITSYTAGYAEALRSVDAASYMTGFENGVKSVLMNGYTDIMTEVMDWARLTVKLIALTAAMYILFMAKGRDREYRMRKAIADEATTDSTMLDGNDSGGDGSAGGDGIRVFNIYRQRRLLRQHQ